MSKLGRGMAALLGDGEDEKEGLQMISLTEIVANPNQPRSTFSEMALQELADSIKENGIIQPIIVEWQESGSYQIIAGERRFRASKMAGLVQIPAIVKNYTEEEKMEVALIENLQREDLSPIEEAKAYFNLIETFKLGQEEVAKKVGKNRSTISNALRLLKLPEKIQEALARNVITAGHARAILSLEETAKQEALFEEIIKNGHNVRDAEKLSKQIALPKEKKELQTKEIQYKAPALVECENKLIEILGSKVSIKGNEETGSILISYLSAEDLDRIVSIISTRN